MEILSFKKGQVRKDKRRFTCGIGNAAAIISREMLVVEVYTVQYVAVEER